MKYISGFVAVAFAAVIITLAFHNVPKHVTQTDRIYIKKILEDGGYNPDTLMQRSDFDAQIKVIRAVQDAILKHTPEQANISIGEGREPADLYRLSYAHCGDRSRFLDKAFRDLGYETRYAYIYETDDITSPFLALLSRDRSKVTSHALVEVKTVKGWIVVDSNERWIALTNNGVPLSLEDIQAARENGQSIAWDQGNSGEIYFILEDSFAYLYGLYSRHGGFYEPYTPIPDINWPEMMQNITAAEF